MYWGGKLGYGSPRTLTDMFCKNCKGDIRELRPSVMVAIPSIWETIRKGVIKKVRSSPKLVQALFWGSFYTKSFMMSYNIPGSNVIDRTIFKKLKEATGGRLRLALSGGAPLAAETQHFISTTLCPLIVGYGMTETAALCTLMSPNQIEYGTVGMLTCCVEVKLVDVPDAGYFSTSKPQ